MNFIREINHVFEHLAVCSFYLISKLGGGKTQGDVQIRFDEDTKIVKVILVPRTRFAAQGVLGIITNECNEKSSKLCHYLCTVLRTNRSYECMLFHNPQ